MCKFNKYSTNFVDYLKCYYVCTGYGKHPGLFTCNF